MIDGSARNPKIESQRGQVGLSASYCGNSALLYMLVLELLDKTDRSLAFAAFGAAQYDSYPVAVFPVASSHHSAEEELLLCFDGSCPCCVFFGSCIGVAC